MILLDRIDKIINDIDFQDNYKGLLEAEKDRVFCNHDITHLLDVARAGWIIYMEENMLTKANDPDALKREKEVVYAAALLHDIGRFEEYSGGREHDLAGADIAERILGKYDFSKEEIKLIKGAILSHRSKNQAENDLGQILKRADKITRRCFACQAKSDCNWPLEKKNHTIII